MSSLARVVLPPALPPAIPIRSEEAAESEGAFSWTDGSCCQVVLRGGYWLLAITVIGLVLARQKIRQGEPGLSQCFRFPFHFVDRQK